MSEYHKINSLFKRDERGKFMPGEFARPEFEFLMNNPWVFTEKVDGTNVRVYWNHETKKVVFGGRTDNAQMPTFLYRKLEELFPPEKLEAKFPEFSAVLYGEGYGAKIQKGGGNYNSGGQDFCLFDVHIGMWLERANVEEIGASLGLKVAPIIGEGTIGEAMALCMKGFFSTWGNFMAEGIVLRPKTELADRRGERIITKLKCRDFR